MGAAFGAVLTYAPANAVVLTPGNAVSNGFSYTGLSTFPGASPVAYNLQNYNGNGLVGSVESWVFQNGATYDFWYRVNNHASSKDLHRFVVNGYTTPLFAPVSTDVDYSGASSGVLPAIIDRSSGNGTTVGFYFINGLGGAIAQGTTSKLMKVSTNATTYSLSTGAVINGSSLNMGGVYAPVPEPMTMGLAGVALLAVARRRKARAST